MMNKIIEVFKIETVRFVSKKSILMKILAAAIVIITIIVIASCFKGNTYGNSIGNSYNRGIAVQDGKWIYYAGIEDDEIAELNKVKTNGKKIENVSDSGVYGLNIIGNYIYGIEYNDEENSYNLIKIKTNGKNKKIIVKDIDKGQITANKKWIYFYKNKKLYRSKLNGKNVEKVSDKNISYYSIEGNWIYYIYNTENSQGYIARMKLNGEDTQRIAKAEQNERYETLYLKGNKIYYVSSKVNSEYEYEYSLYKMNKKGEKVEQICKIDNSIQSINMQENGIYYTTTDNYTSYKIKYMKYNGKDKKTIAEETRVIAINITEDWVVVQKQGETQIKMISINKNKEKDL